MSPYVLLCFHMSSWLKFLCTFFAMWSRSEEVLPGVEMCRKGLEMTESPLFGLHPTSIIEGVMLPTTAFLTFFEDGVSSRMWEIWRMIKAARQWESMRALVRSTISCICSILGRSQEQRPGSHPLNHFSALWPKISSQWRHWKQSSHLLSTENADQTNWKVWQVW